MQTTPSNGIHAWEAPTVIVESYSVRGWGGRPMPPDVVLYADGTLIVRQWDGAGTWQSLVGHVSQAEICAFLTDLERDGLFDFKAEDYPDIGITDLGDTHIRVNGWRKQDLALYGLAVYVSLVTEKEREIKPSIQGLVAAYSRMLAFRAAKMVPYRPERIALRIRRQTNPSYHHGSAREELWPFTPTVAKMLGRRTEAVVILEGEAAQRRFEFFGREESVEIHEGDEPIGSG